MVITHDDQYYGVADRLVRLDSGQVVADGVALPTAAVSR